MFFFDKLFENWKIHFSFRKKNSPSNKASSKTQNGHAASIIGDNNSIIFETQNRNVIVENESWDQLLSFFTQKTGKKLADIIEDPKNIHRKNNFESLKKLTGKKFKDVNFPSSSPNAEPFNKLKENALSTLETYAKTEEEKTFLEEWDLISQKLKEIGP